jgi:D-amino-acid oxidase
LELVMRRRCQVVLQSPVHPLDTRTCSMGAGGLWMPFRCDDPRADRWALETLTELLAVQSKDLVEILPVVAPRHQPEENLPLWTADPRIQFQQLAIEQLRNKKNLRIPPLDEFQTAGYNHAWLFNTPIVNAPTMLEHLLTQLRQQCQEVNVETDEYMESIPHMRDTAARLGCDAVINCTGLGAASICKEQDQMVGARGILLHYDRDTCVRRVPGGDQDTLIMIDEEPWGSETMPCYMIPRGDVVVVGGSYLPGDTETSIRPEERERLLSNAEKMGIDIGRSKPVGEWTGFRPKRSLVRCELDPTSLTDGGVTVVHNYGHGGSGWTVNVGAAKECVDLLLGPSK